jgi:branched-chain amino acid transport system ATP-binding protein
MHLEARSLSVFFGAVRALAGIDFSVKPGEIVALVGPNGAGKSTALKAVFGLIEPDGGEVLFNGEKIGGLRPDQRVTKGISLVPEGRHLFPSMTVTENLEMGAFACDWKNRKQDMEKVLELLPALQDRRKLKAGILSTGEQQLLAIKPTRGLSPAYEEIIFDILLEINRQRTGILLVEQNATQALEISHRGYVLRFGSVFAEGMGTVLLENGSLKGANWSLIHNMRDRHQNLSYNSRYPRQK